jgi:hypothetical protein
MTDFFGFQQGSHPMVIPVACWAGFCFPFSSAYPASIFMTRASPEVDMQSQEMEKHSGTYNNDISQDHWVAACAQ